MRLECSVRRGAWGLFRLDKASVVVPQETNQIQGRLKDVTFSLHYDMQQYSPIASLLVALMIVTLRADPKVEIKPL